MRINPIYVVAPLLIIALAAMVGAYFVFGPRPQPSPMAPNTEISRDNTPADRKPPTLEHSPLVLPEPAAKPEAKPEDPKPAPKRDELIAELRPMIEKMTWHHRLNLERVNAMFNIYAEEGRCTDEVIALARDFQKDSAVARGHAESAIALTGADAWPELNRRLKQIVRMLDALAGDHDPVEPWPSEFALDYHVTILGRMEEVQRMLDGRAVVEVPPPDDPDPETPPVDPKSTPVSPLDGQDVKADSGEHKTIGQDSRLNSVKVESGSRLNFRGGTLSVGGDFEVAKGGTFDGGEGTLNFNGASQALSGQFGAKRITFSGGEKHLTAGSRVRTNLGEHSGPNDPAMVVEAGCTLVIDKDAYWETNNPYGVRIAGTLIIDGGTFQCSFTHGRANGYNSTWMPGSQLIIRSGKFIGSGDADFTNCSIYIDGGELRVEDDIWGSGDLVELRGGVMSNQEYGGMFAITGALHINGGRLEANQGGDRGLQIRDKSEVSGYSGEVVIGGDDVDANSGGIVLLRDAVLPNLKVTRNTAINGNAPEGTTLTVTGAIEIDKGKKLYAKGKRVIGEVKTDDNHGELVP